MNKFTLNGSSIYAIIDNVDASIYWKDLRGKYLGCNQYMLNMINFENRALVIGKTDYELPWSSVAASLEAHDNLAIKYGNYSIEEDYITKDGNKRFYLTRKSKLLDSGGNVVGVMGTSVDITDRKEKEKLELENQTQLVSLKANENFKKCLDEIQHTIQSYRINTLNEKLRSNPHTNISGKDIALTKREREILYYLSLNKSPKDIAAILTILEEKNVSDGTINAIINKQLYPKFEVFNIGQLIEKASILKFIPFLLET